MSVSNNNGSPRALTAQSILELALRRAGVPPAKFTSEMVEIAFDEFNLMLDEMLNLGMQLWGRDAVIVPLYINNNQVPMPLGTSVVISVNQRYLSRVETINWFSDQGGDPALAFDNDFATACVQLLQNGSIGGYFTSPTILTTIGVLLSGAQVYGIFYEYTQDGGLTWVPHDAAEFNVQAGAPQWFWHDLNGAPAADGWRIRSVSQSNLSVNELYFGNSPTEIPMGVWSRDDWNAMTVKNSPGPPFNYYQQRDLDVPVLYVWPMPNDQAKYYQLVCWRRRYLAALTDMNQTLDISRRWNAAITASMARRLCLTVPEANKSLMQELKEQETLTMTLATGEERDPGPMRYNPGLDVYTRS